MGAFAPTPLLDGALREVILRTIVEPVLDGMIAEGMPYSGSRTSASSSDLLHTFYVLRFIEVQFTIIIYSIIH